MKRTEFKIREFEFDTESTIMLALSILGFFGLLVVQLAIQFAGDWERQSIAELSVAIENDALYMAHRENV